MTFGLPDRGVIGLRGARGFTLLEIMLVLALIIIMFLGAVPLVTASGGERRLRTAAEDIEGMVRAQRARAVSSGNRLLLDVREGGFYERGNKERPVMALPKGATLSLRAPGGEWGKPDGQEWEFSPAGFVTPYSVRLVEGDSWIEVDIDLLTGRVAEERYAL
jgi:prepilin-type N-terminal cleavage/methylation domain-containing protein